MQMPLDYDPNKNSLGAQKCAAVITMAVAGAAIVLISLFSYRNPNFAYVNPSAATGLALSLVGSLAMLMFGGCWYLVCRRYEEKS